MGLDVTAFAKARLTDDENGWRAYNANGKDRMDGKPEGHYEGDNTFDFRAGSYGGYNEWRAWLSITFLGATPEKVWNHPQSFDGKPFVELIDFGDNEGTFGPLTSAKLAKDFQEHRNKLPQTVAGWMEGRYEAWQKAFEIASDDGFVILH